MWADYVHCIEVVPSQQLSIQNHQGCTRNLLRSYCKRIIKRSIFASNHCINEKRLSLSESKVLHERKRVVKRLSFPFTIETGYIDDDDNISTFFTHLHKHLNAFCRFCRPHTIIGTVSLTDNY